ncbi:SDR family oxidoreductase [Parahaliea sp. F7430]|uniref:SDR family oxidoreductase n=1 Tax=Sediminihaliea albiluteola TaxID=2758564 RepID=A0A7W2YIB3_9GAMM|nr:SDR family NAD(P)-dependent oxidoreductase [Sediminihaliea albiluteola]MBA6411875.1 SDR family oxidoreductase [Sediminihaliea albiluteola]
MKQFDGKVAFITGAASGIGLATMQRLAADGAKVFACDINSEALEAAASALRDSGSDVLSLSLDVTDDAGCQAAIAACVEHFGQLDILCNIAGMVCTGHFADLSIERWRRVMDVNANSVFVLCQAAMPHLLESGGNIVNIASTAALAGLPYNSAYCASKAAVLQLSKALATEYAHRGVRVNAICPGAVNTPLVKDAQIPEGADAALFQRMFPLTGTFAEAREIAASVAYLASDDARFVTGSALVIDGGQTAI